MISNTAAAVCGPYARLRAGGAAAALILAAALATTAQAKGSSVHYTTVVVGGVGRFTAPGEPASVPLDLTDAAPSETSGVLAKGAVIARHQVRARDAVVLDAAVTVGVKRELAAGTVLFKVVSERGTVAWCEAHYLSILARNRVQCLADSSNQGKFDRSLVGWTVSDFVGLEGATTLQDGLILGAAAPYHRAAPEQRPTAVVGYRYCDGDGVVGPPRFALAVSSFSSPDHFPSFYATCAHGIWPNLADKSVVDVNGLRLKVTTEPAAAAGAPPVIHYELDGRAAPGPILKLADKTGLWRDPAYVLARANPPPVPVVPVPVVPVPVAPAAAAAAAAAPGAAPPLPVPPSPPRAAPSIPPLPVPPVAPRVNTEPALIFAGRPTVHPGPLAIGQPLITAQVKHGITGVLQNRIQPKLFWTSDTPLEVGQPMFGMPVANSETVIWCAPRKRDTGAYDTACFTGEGAMLRWMAHCSPALMPWDRVYGCASGGASSAPSVERKPVDLPPIRMDYTLTDVRPDPSFPGAMDYTLAMMLDWGEGPQKIRTQRYRVTANETGYFLFMGLYIRLKQGEDPTQLMAEINPVQRGLVSD